MIADDARLAEATVECLEAQGDVCLTTATPESAAAYDALFDSAAATFDVDADAVLHICGGADQPPPAAAETSGRSAECALLLVRALAGRHSDAKVWFVTRGRQHAAVRGLAATFALEHPANWGAHIEIEGGPERAQAIADETRRTGAGDHVRLTAGGRQVARLARLTRGLRAPAAIRADRSYVVTGGFGAIGLAVARALGDGGARHLMLISRSGANTADRQEALAALRGRGIDVVSHRLDVSDAAAVRAIMSTLAPPVAGIVHTAGEPIHGPLRDTHPAALASAIAVKAGGAMAFADAAPDADFVVAVSSMIGTWAAEDQGAYAAANAAVDAVATQGAHRMVSVALGPVRGGMLPDALALHLERAGVTVWAPDHAAAVILRLAGATGRHVIAAEIDWARYKPLMESRGRRSLFADFADMPSRSTPGVLSARLLVAGAAERTRLLTDLVRNAAASALGMHPDAWPDLGRGFFEMGMDSLTALELRKRLERAIDRALPATLVFDYPNVNALAHTLGDLLAPPLTARPAAPIVFTTMPHGVGEPAAASGARPDDTAAAIAARLDALERLVGRS